LIFFGKNQQAKARCLLGGALIYFTFRANGYIITNKNKQFSEVNYVRVTR